MIDVSIRGCQEYNQQLVDSAIKKAIDDLGGIKKFVKQSDRVLLKANLLKKNKPNDMVTTHPTIIIAIIKLLQNEGITDITIADSPGGPFNTPMLKTVYSSCGMEKVAKEMNVKLNYDVGFTTIYNPDAIILKNFDLCNFIINSDVIIDCAKMKTHCMTAYTGAVKNLFGCIPGTTKVEYHYRMPKLEDFSNMLLDLANYVKPSLCIMDAIYAMEGDGPSAGIPKKVGAVMASSNATAIDMLSIALMNIEPTKICTVMRAKERGIIKGDIKEDINILGEDYKNYIAKDFIMAKTSDIKLFSGKLPKFLEEIVSKHFTPYPIVKKDMCVGCGICKKSCPPKAIEMKNNLPIIDKDKCINCFCCHELCPYKAMDVKKPFISKIIK